MNYKRANTTVNSVIVNCEVKSKIQSNMSLSICELNNIEVEAVQRSYDSLIIDTEYLVEKVCLLEDENGIQLLMFFDDNQCFIKLPPRYRNYYYAHRNELENLHKIAIQLELAFKFKGYSENGIANFKFGSPGTLKHN